VNSTHGRPAKQLFYLLAAEALKIAKQLYYHFASEAIIIAIQIFSLFLAEALKIGAFLGAIYIESRQCVLRAHRSESEDSPWS
jgi:hypothetical protein